MISSRSKLLVNLSLQTQKTDLNETNRISYENAKKDLYYHNDPIPCTSKAIELEDNSVAQDVSETVQLPPLISHDYKSDENDQRDADSDVTFLPSEDDKSDGSDYNGFQQHNKKLTRLKKRNPDAWKVNVTKSQRSQCMPYKNKKRNCPAKTSKPIDCTNCIYKCNSKFTAEDRHAICKTYWQFAHYQWQKDFILKFVQREEPKRRKVDVNNSKARSISKYYYLENASGRHRVCAKFFEKTLCISNGPINIAIKGSNVFGCYNSIDMRGRKPPGIKTSDYNISMVKKHIESFPVMESHYSRMTTKKLYLDSTLSICKMYDLYKSNFCNDNEVINPVSEKTYRRIFCNNYNFSFFKPKKDLCALCYKYENAANIEKKKELETDYCLHLIRKGQCMRQNN